MRYAGIQFRTDNDSGIASVSLWDNTASEFVFENELIDLYYGGAVAADGKYEDFVYWVTLDNDDHTYTFDVSHSGTANASSVGINDAIQVVQFLTQTAITNGSFPFRLKFSHTDHVGYEVIVDAETGAVTDITGTQTFVADGTSTGFMLSGSNRAFALKRVGKRTTAEITAGSDITWSEIYDPLITWGTDYLDETIDSDGYTGVEFETAPGVGAVYIEYYVKFNRVTVTAKLKQPYDSAEAYVDYCAPVRGIDYNLELIGKV